MHRGRFCLIGCGEHAEHVHAPALTACAGRMPWLERVACCDLDRARAERVRSAAGFALAYTDAHAMLHEQRPDAVAIVVPPDLMVRVAVPILEAGIPALIEKPPGVTVGDLDALRFAAAHGSRRGTPNQVALNRRFAPVLVAAREVVARIGGAQAVQHVQYEMTRVGRTDADFTLTAIHAIDAARFLADSDYGALRFTYVDAKGTARGVVNYFASGSFESGASVHVACVPAAGVVVERAVIHAGGHTIFAQVPMWAAFDAPGRMQHLHRGRLVEEYDGAADDPGLGTTGASFIAGGFLAQYLAFFGALQRRTTADAGFRRGATVGGSRRRDASAAAMVRGVRAARAGRPMTRAVIVALLAAQLAAFPARGQTQTGSDPTRVRPQFPRRRGPGRLRTPSSSAPTPGRCTWLAPRAWATIRAGRSRA